MEYVRKRKRKRKKLKKLVQFNMAGLEEDTKAQLKMVCSIWGFEEYGISQKKKKGKLNLRFWRIWNILEKEKRETQFEVLKIWNLHKNENKDYDKAITIFTPKL